MRLVLLALAFILLLCSCAEPVPAQKRDYVGHWQSPSMSLLILEDGTVAYKRYKNGGSTSVEGPLQSFEGDDFSVGIGFFSTTFIVNEPPNNNDGQWTMVVDNERLIKQPSAYTH